MGFIRSKFLAKGAQNFFAYPTTDELPTFGNGGRFNDFHNLARILWKNGASEAFEVHGSILGQWGSLGSEWSSLASPARPVAGARSAVVNASGNFTLDQSTQGSALCYSRSTDIKTVNGFVTARVVESDTGKTAVSRFVTGAGDPHTGPI